jgi:hypothetical protein
MEVAAPSLSALPAKREFPRFFVFYRFPSEGSPSQATGNSEEMFLGEKMLVRKSTVYMD